LQQAEDMVKSRVGGTLTNHQLPLVEFQKTLGCSVDRLDFKGPPTAVGGIPKDSGLLGV
jgi:hypothetical protein